MSFLNNNPRPERTPGLINGNPVSGLNERVCIQVKKVFDACIRQETLENENIIVTSYSPSTSTPVEPFRFVSAASSTYIGTISNLIIEPLSDGKGCSRCKFNITVPLNVIFFDATNTRYTGAASITVAADILLFIPEPSIMPFEIDTVVNCNCPEGSYIGANTFNVTCCLTIITKVVIEVELLVPSYGYCFIPPCQEFTEEVCTGAFDLPIFPSGNIRRG
jgi:hypothetical protein